MMFKDILRSLSKFFTTQKIVLLLVFIILAWALYTYSGSKSMVLDGMETGSVPTVAGPGPESIVSPSAPIVPESEKKDKEGYSAQSVAVPSDLLPTDANSKWAALNPVNQSGVAMPDLLQAGYHIGLDTIGQTLRNPNYQLRSDPLIPKSDIGPWNQSTIEPDVGRVPLEVGQGPK